MDSITLFLIVFLIALLVIMLYPLVLYVVKITAPFRNDFFWIYRCKIYRMSVNLAESRYFGKGCTSTDKYRWLADYPTIDDEVLIEIASNLNKICEGKSDRYKAGMLLAFVQQNVKYTSDYEQYGKSEYYAIPIQPLTSKEGDCEDTAILYNGIAYNMGLKCRLIIVTGHATAGVTDIVGLAGFDIDGKKYIVAETTNYIPILGLYFGKTDVRASAVPQKPSQSFLDTLRPTNND